MFFYADFPARRTRQITIDVAAVLLIGLWIVIGRWVFHTISTLAEYGVRVEDAGSEFSTTMSNVAGTLADVPLIGEAVSAPFASAGAAGRDLESLGQAQQDLVAQAATMTGVAVAVVPIVAVLLLWAVPRLRFALRKRRVALLVSRPGAIDLLALRALVGTRPDRLLAAIPGAAEGWRQQDPAVLRRLAALEARGAGLTLRAGGIAAEG
ncbi:MAG: hypothetical protein CVT68_08405 [Actinobacteria bacterium HGW-Actinobacteria-8]|nr:MAG: hypothetical protein CVT68_08405 [Actinobacteria bacterium HGW-Actinobacteria-8]